MVADLRSLKCSVLFARRVREECRKRYRNARSRHGRSAREALKLRRATTHLMKLELRLAQARQNVKPLPLLAAMEEAA